MVLELVIVDHTSASRVAIIPLLITFHRILHKILWTRSLLVVLSRYLPYLMPIISVPLAPLRRSKVVNVQVGVAFMTSLIPVIYLSMMAFRFMLALCVIRPLKM